VASNQQVPLKVNESAEPEKVEEKDTQEEHYTGEDRDMSASNEPLLMAEGRKKNNALPPLNT